MARVRRIVVSQIEGGYSGSSNKRPNGEIGLYDDDDGGFDLVIHDGVNSTSDNKVLGKGKLFGNSGTAKIIVSGTSSSEWNFYSDGNLRLPSGGDIIDNNGISVLSGGVLETTYSELKTSITNQELIPGRLYDITDYKTCYDQPNFDYNKNEIITGNYRIGETHSLIVMAISATALSVDAYQPDYPMDKIKYDINWSQTEVTGGTAYGRITERIDDRNNRTDFDHREVKFVRYPFWTWDKDSQYAGTVSVTGEIVQITGTTMSGMTMSGVDTDFTIFSIGDVIAIPELTGLFFSVRAISSSTEMVIYSDVLDNVSVATDLRYYRTYFQDNISYYQTPLMGEAAYSSSEHTMFGESNAFNNYFGDVANLVIGYQAESFILPNNVFFGSVINNYVGNDCINNTVQNEFNRNQIQNSFMNNISDDDILDNVIGSYFINNVICSDFRRNKIGNNFENNYIICEDFDDNVIEGDFLNNNFWDDDDYDIEDNYFGKNFSFNEIYREFSNNRFGNSVTSNNFYRDVTNNTVGNSFYENAIYTQFNNNQIGNDFYYNTIGNIINVGDFDFRNNQIGNKFKGNLIEGEFIFNFILDNFSYNEVGNYFSGNKIGKGFVDNDISNSFQDNNIGESFGMNNIGNDFRNNKIANNFVGNSVGVNFAYNDILNNFYGNTIANDFGFGGNEVRGNRIGNDFQYNQIGEYFYDNLVADLFTYNTVGEDFMFNDIKANSISNYNFDSNRDVITSITDNVGATPSVPGIDSTYFGLTASGGQNSNATFNVTVTGSVVTAVSINYGGNLYSLSDTLTISGSKFGGTDGQDIIITVIGLSGIPVVYTDTNSTIVRDRNGNVGLYYLGSMNFEKIGMTDTFLP